jgi:hypothetical protein
MTEEQFLKKYEDRIAGVCMRGIRNMARSSGSSEGEGRALRQMTIAIDELLAEIASDLFPKPVVRPAPPPPHGRK